jgi:hypothetical protein
MILAPALCLFFALLLGFGSTGYRWMCRRLEIPRETDYEDANAWAEAIDASLNTEADLSPAPALPFPGRAPVTAATADLVRPARAA